jgi:transposase
VSRCIPTGDATITLGVDTHKDTYVGVARDGLGRFQGTLRVAANLAGYKRLLAWASEFGHLEHVGGEGTGTFGAGLARFPKAQGIKVFELIRPKCRDQYRTGKSDPTDAEAAACAALAGTAPGVPKDADGEVEVIRALRITRHSVVKARTLRQPTNCKLCW